MKVLLVDDKESVVQGINKHVAWKELGVSEVVTALDGKEALEKYRTAPADLVITDIKMPNLNGIELIEQLRGSGRPIRFIVLSGYDEFEYAQKAIALGVSEYVLKPVDIQQLTEKIGRALHELRDQHEQNEQKKKFQQTIRRSLPALRQQYLTEMVLFRNDNRYPLKDKWDFAEIPLRPNGFGLFVAAIDRFSEISRQPVEEVELSRFILENIVSDCIPSQRDGIAFFSEWGRLTVLMNDDPHKTDQENKERLLLIAERCRQAVGSHSKLTVSIGVSSLCSELSSLPEAYRQACEAIEHYSFYGNNHVMHYEDLLLFRKQQRADYPAHEAQKLLALIKRGQTESADEAVHDFFAVLQREGGTPRLIRLSCIQLMVDLHRILTDMDMTDDSSEHDWYKACSELAGAELQDYILLSFKHAADRFARILQAGSRTIVEQTKAFVEDHLLKACSLTEAAEDASVSPNYLSTLFKKETGISFVEYVTDRKINRAKEWLSDPNVTITVMAERLGYSDKKYFRELFKKKTGFTPSEYRDRTIGGDDGV